MNIPKIISQIWIGDSPLPDKYLANIQSIKDKNPNWQHILWDESNIEELIYSIDKKYFAKYLSFQYLHQRVDYARYCILYKLGGVSVDIDCEALKGFSETPNIDTSDFIVSRNSTNQFINNACILVSKENPLMKELIDSIVTDCKFYQDKSICILQTTGPQAFTRFVKKHSEITILDHVYFEPCGSLNSACKIPEEAILNHKHEMSWVSPFYKNIIKAQYFAMEHKEILIIIAVAILIIFLIRK